MAKSLFVVKPIEQLLSASTDGKHGLKRALTATNLTLLGIGGIIGAGIFVLTGQAAAQFAGPGIILSFIFSGIACIFAGLCYAEFASMIPIAGSAYTYAYATLGEFIAWIIGWNLILEYLFSAATVAVGWSGYVTSFLRDLGLTISPVFTNATGTKLIEIPNQGFVVITEQLLKNLQSSGIDPSSLTHLTAYCNIPAMLIVVLITWLLLGGVKESVFFNSIIVFLKLSVIVLFIVFGFRFINTENWVPFIPPNNGHFGEFGWSGIFRGAGVVFCAYIGFDAISTAAQETKNPQRDMPIGILASLAICTILYIFVSLVLTGIVKYPNLMVAEPIAVAVNVAGAGLRWFRPILNIGAIAGLSSVILVWLMGQSRIFFAMANDGLLPRFFGKVHPKFQTPYIATLVTGLVAVIVSGTLPISLLGELVSIGTLLAFAIVCIGIMILRKTKPELKRPFRTPWVPFVPIMGALFAIIQMISLSLDTWIRLIIWSALGVLIYMFYGKVHSKAQLAARERAKNSSSPLPSSCNSQVAD